MSQEILVRDAMWNNTVTLNPEQSVEEAAAKLAEYTLLGAPVVDSVQEIIGYVSEYDLLKKVLSSSYHGDYRTSVSEVMRTEVISVGPNDSIIEAAETMAQPNGPRLFPVVENKKVIGLITRSMVLKALVNNRNKSR